MKKLWTAHVSVNFEMAIVAESHEEAIAIAKQNASDEHNNLSPRWYIDVHHVPPPVELDDSIPYGSDDDQTVAEIKAGSEN